MDVLALKAAYPRHTWKHLADELQCSPRQAKRMLASRHIPLALQSRVAALIKRARERNQIALTQIYRELGELNESRVAADQGHRPRGLGRHYSPAVDRPGLGHGGLIWKDARAFMRDHGC